MAQSDALLQINGIEGETQQDSLDGYMELLSWSIGGSNSSTFGSGTGGGKGKSVLQDLHCTKTVDKASANIFKYCAFGNHIDEVKLVVRKAAGEDKLTYITITLTNCFITSYQTSGGSDGGAMESFSVTYEKINHEYQPQDKTGAADGGSIEFTYNVATGKDQ
ncbi:type VI secretion system tube protein Hcp [Labrys sp. LIt4]|uniref:Type VI secretion system tube protein Hcp n=1 Tax=Labrys okinawensis TaxID=346911 RepID=A0A2S9QJR0_9HYPH|nr:MULTISPECIES: type VI secretion system tube protein Hcp [Labrys]MBP0580450.1 type VI secretion system tube protein Hcp [Labrys sp. LIt4]PRH89581.1 type VI secretion system tube protein Hcp [Labrys okinawensis]